MRGDSKVKRKNLKSNSKSGFQLASSEVKEKGSLRREVVPGKRNEEFYSLWLVGLKPMLNVAILAPPAKCYKPKSLRVAGTYT